MKCLENIERTHIPNDVIMQYIKLYKSIGNNQYNHETLSGDYEAMVRQTIKNDTYYFAKIFDVEVSDSRFKSLIFKDVKHKNKNEYLLKNIRNAFMKIHDDISTFDLLVTEIQDLLSFLYGNILPKNKLQFRKFKKEHKSMSLLSSDFASTRDILEQQVRLFNEMIEERKYESSYLIANFYIDFLKVAPFEEKNEEIGLLLMYVLLMANGYEVFEYVSFMQSIYKKKELFDKAVMESSFNWKEGYAQVLPVHRIILNISLESYQTLNYLVRDYEFDKHLNKSNNIENTILKLDDIFTKDDIRHIHPFISDSTINRTLRRLRDDGVIRPLGKGRSAKWMRLKESKKQKFVFEQLDLKI